MTKPKIRLLFSVAVLYSLGFQAAQASTPPANKDLRSYITGMNFDPRVLLRVQGDGGTLIQEKPVPGAKPEFGRTPGDGKITRCTKTKHSISKNFDEIAILQPTEGVVFPGAIVFADQNLVDGKPRPLTILPKAPINLRVELPGLEEKGNFTVEKPSSSKVQAEISKVLRNWNDSAAYKEGYVNSSRSSYNSTIAYSSEQLAIGLGFNAKWASGEASAQFNFNSSSERKVAVVVFKQVFYSVIFDTPELPEAVFEPDVSVADAKEVFSASAPPAYVSSVNYGRIIMLRAETDKSTTSADLEAAFKYASGEISAGGDLKTKYDKIISNSQLTVVTMGGNAEVASQAVSAKNADDLMSIIKGKNSVYSKDNPGVPIAYTVKFLKDNTIAKTGTTTDYTSEDCQELLNMWIKVVHSGAFIGHFDVSYQVPDAKGNMQNMNYKEHGKTTGFQKIFSFPGDAQNIRLKMTNDTGLVWDPQREIFNRTLTANDLNSCFEVTGTTLGSTYNKNCR